MLTPVTYVYNFIIASLSNWGIIFVMGDLWLIEYGTHIYIIYMSDFYQSWGDSGAITFNATM